MDGKAILDFFSGDHGDDKARAYLEAEGLLFYFEEEARKNEDRFSPNWSDLARLHLTIRVRRVFKVLEFGVGFSSIAIADALSKNEKDWDGTKEKPQVRNGPPFQVHSIDTSRAWLDVVKQSIPNSLSKYICLHYSPAYVGEFAQRFCHYYDFIPDIVPDLIYLDGPDPGDVTSLQNGVNPWKNPQQPVNAADLLRVEPMMIPGTLILIDGRQSNVRFLKHFFYRNWSVDYDKEQDVTVMELQEPPLGKINTHSLSFCIGPRFMDW